MVLARTNKKSPVFIFLSGWGQVTQVKDAKNVFTGTEDADKIHPSKPSKFTILKSTFQS